MKLVLLQQKPHEFLSRFEEASCDDRGGARGYDVVLRSLRAASKGIKPQFESIGPFAL